MIECYGGNYPMVVHIVQYVAITGIHGLSFIYHLTTGDDLLTLPNLSGLANVSDGISARLIIKTSKI